MYTIAYKMEKKCCKQGLRDFVIYTVLYIIRAKISYRCDKLYM